MSIEQMTKVFDDTTLNPTRKLIMLSLADSANGSGVSFPSFSTLMDKTNLSRQTVNDNIKWLSKNDYLFKKNRSRRKGGRSSNKYLIYPLENREILDEEDFLIFEDLYTQSQTDRLPPQSQTTRLGSGTQSQTTRLESEPSLKSNHHYKKNKQKKESSLDAVFRDFVKGLETRFEEIKISTYRDKISAGKNREAVGYLKQLLMAGFDVTRLVDSFADYVQHEKKYAKRLPLYLIAQRDGVNLYSNPPSHGEPEVGSVAWYEQQAAHSGQAAIEAEVM